MNEPSNKPELALGVSSCLLGKPVRFDGSHKLDRYITETLGKIFTFVPVCPEVETGMGVPRETIDLHGGSISPRLIGNETGLDRTIAMNRWTSRRVRRTDLSQVCGFILKSRSPTCGLKNVKLVGRAGRSSFRGIGLFAMALRRRYPLLPVVEERELQDSSARENFIVRLFAYHRMHAALSNRPTVRKLRLFHQRERYLLDAHNLRKRRLMDQLLSQPLVVRPSMLRDEYVRLFMQALDYRSTVAKNFTVLNRVCCVLNRHTASINLKRCSLLIDKYHDGNCRLLKPLLELRRCAEKFGVDELLEQSWLFPDHREILLRFKV